MIFNSLEYLVFFAIVAPVYFLLPQRFRWTLLLAASLWFYMAWRADYVILIIASIALDYVCSNGMGRTENPVARNAYLMASICGNLGLLFAFKYFNFFNSSLRVPVPLLRSALRNTQDGCGVAGRNLVLHLSNDELHP